MCEISFPIILLLALFGFMILFHYVTFFSELSSGDIGSKKEFWAKIIFPPIWWVWWVVKKYNKL